MRTSNIVLKKNKVYLILLAFPRILYHNYPEMCVKYNIKLMGITCCKPVAANG